MDKLQAKKRIEELKKVINHHRYLYHVLDKLEISDAALDSLKHELQTLEQRYPEFIAPDSPTQRVGGAPLEKFAKVRHKVKQWSLEDAFSEREIREWEKRLRRFLGLDKVCDFVGELKIDGLHIVLTYEKGVLKTGATRGDGEMGEDVTQNLKTIEAIPLKLQKPIDCVAEGEVFMRKSVFEKLNENLKKEGKPLLANPRNAAAGAIRQLDPTIAANRRLDAFIYDLVWPRGLIPETQKDELEFLSRLGFKVNAHGRYVKTIDGVITFWKYWEKKKDSEDYWIDGIVCKVADRSLQEKLGYTGKAPRWALAAKFSPEQKTTRMRGIIASVGRTGKITPVALLEPVEIKGTIVSRATLHNYDEVARLDVREGDTVVVAKAGEVIPQVISVIKDLRKKGAKVLSLPKHCPICKKPLDRVKGEVDIFCSNPSCGALRAKKFIFFASKAGLDIEGLGEKIVSRFMDEGLITDIVSIFDLKEADIKELERFGEKSAKNLIEAIERAKHIPLWKFLHALGIDYIGSQTALWIQNWLILFLASLEKKKFGAIQNPEKLLAIWRKLTSQNLREIPGIGPKASESFIVFIRSKQNQELLKELSKRGMSFVIEDKGGALFGKIFLFTGTLETMSRDQAQEKVREKGGEVASSVSKKLDYLVFGRKPGSKLDKAKKLGIPTLSEEAFLSLFLDTHTA